MSSAESLQGLLAQAQARKAAADAALSALDEVQRPLLHQALALAREHAARMAPLYQAHRGVDPTTADFETTFGCVPPASAGCRGLRWEVEGDVLAISGSYPMCDWEEYFSLKVPLRYLGENAAALLDAEARALQDVVAAKVRAQTEAQAAAEEARQWELYLQLQKRYGTA